MAGPARPGDFYSTRHRRVANEFRTGWVNLAVEGKTFPSMWACARRDRMIRTSPRSGRGLPGASRLKRSPGAMRPDTRSNAIRQKLATTRTEIDEVEKLLAKAPANKPSVKKLVDEARGKLNFVLLDDSVGFHNQAKTMTYIAEARKLAEKAAKSK